MSSTKYRISIHYETGNSFGRETLTEFLDGASSLETAKENLCRIKAHYLYYSWKNRPHRDEDKLAPVKPVTWHPKYEEVVTLITDAGKSYQISAFWCGYFETLYEASVVCATDDDMSFSPT